MTRMSALLAIASAALATAAAPAHALKPFTAQYDASFKGISAGGSMSLSQQGNRWTYAMGIRNAMANLSQATVFEDAAGRYRPLGGSDRSTYLMKTRSVVTHYNWKGMQARWTGDVKMCVAENEFKITGVQDCFARGFQRMGFKEYDTGRQGSWMVQLSDTPGTQESQN